MAWAPDDSEGLLETPGLEGVLDGGKLELQLQLELELICVGDAL